MKQTRPKPLSALLLTLLFLWVQSAHAQLIFTTNNGAITITSYTGRPLSVVIPSAINDHPVTAIGDHAFSWSDLSSVVIPDSVTRIGNHAFSDCYDLADVMLGSGITNIGDSAFAHCPSLSSVTIPNSVVTIGNGSFSWCSGLTSFTIPDSVASIGDGAFTLCSGLTNVDIGSSVTNIGSYAFSDCTALASVMIPNSVINIGESAFFTCASLTNVIVGHSVTSIGRYTFTGCEGLTSVAIPASVVTIGPNAFSSCNSLTNIGVNVANPYFASIDGVLFNRARTTLIEAPAGLYGNYVIPDGVLSIADYGFFGCYGFTTVTIPSSVTNIGTWAFANCYGLAEVTIPSSVLNIGNAAFAYCLGLTNIVVDATNPNYASMDGALFNTTKTTLIQYPSGKTGGYVIPDGVTNLPLSAFIGGSALESVTIPASVLRFDDSTFCYCSGLTNIAVNAANPNYASSGGVLFNKPMSSLILCPRSFQGSYVIPIGVMAICDSAFEGCFMLTSVTIPVTVTTIEHRAFSDCDSLTSVTIPKSVTSIESRAFADCDSLQQAFFWGNAPTGVSGAFNGEGWVYYLPGTAGWADYLGTWFPEPWYQPQPQILTATKASSGSSNAFTFVISWATNTSVTVEASINLQDWIPVQTNHLVNGVLNFQDSDGGAHPQRFYRACSQ